MAYLTKPTFVYNGTNPLVLCQRTTAATSPYFSYYINSRVHGVSKEQDSDFNIFLTDYNNSVSSY